MNEADPHAWDLNWACKYGITEFEKQKDQTFCLVQLPIVSCLLFLYFKT